MMQFRTIRDYRSCGIVLALVLLFCLLNATPAAAQSAYALITIPASGPAPANLQGKLKAWRKAGDIRKVVWLDRLEKEDTAFASLICLEFANESVYQGWLTKARQAIAPATVKALDILTARDSGSHDPSSSVFKVNVYRMKVPAARYRAFAEGYIAPLMDGQVDGGYMTDYVMYAERGKVGESNALLIVEYRNPPAFARVAPFKSTLREKLTREHPTYSRFHKAKDTLRDDVSESLAAWRAVD